jgi:N-acetylglutamate synthase-like GNAT family acetyltransferase
MIREAKVKDREEIQALYKELCPDAPVNVLPARLVEIKNDSNNFLFVYESEGNIVGTVFLTICLSPMFGLQPFGVIDYFIVNEKYRKQGIGSKLTDHVIQVCKEKKCTRIMLISNNDRKEAQEFYKRKGFVSSGKTGFINYLNRK